jgi:hypothetical protein
MLLKGLRPDICNIEDPSKLNKEVNDIQDRIANHISRLACSPICVSPLDMASGSFSSLGFRGSSWDGPRFCANEGIVLDRGLGALGTALVGLNEVQDWLAVSFRCSSISGTGWISSTTAFHGRWVGK